VQSVKSHRVYLQLCSIAIVAPSVLGIFFHGIASAKLCHQANDCINHRSFINCEIPWNFAV